MVLPKLRDRIRSLRSKTSTASSSSYPLYTPYKPYTPPSESSNKTLSKSTNSTQAANSRPRGQCSHKNPTSCLLSSAIACCACLDKRPPFSVYSRYIDGVGQVDHGTRWQHYCSNCSAYWERRARTGNRLEGPFPSQPFQTYLQFSLSRAGHTCNLDVPALRTVSLTIGDVRDEAARILDVRDPELDVVDSSRLKLYLMGEELNDVTMDVEDAGLSFDQRNDLWYTIDLRGSGAKMLDDLEALERQVVSIEQQLQGLDTKQQETPPPPATRPCIICTEDHPPTAFPTRKTTTRCTHAPQVCTRDLDHWILAELSSKGPDRIGCPECANTLQHADIQALASHSTLQKYETAATRALLSLDPDFRWCLSSPACGSGQIHSTGRDGPIMRCGACSFKQCIIHERAWHEGETCGEYDRRMAASKMKGVDAATTRLLAKTTRTCPGKPGQPCGWMIEKAEGCDHMTCSRCKGEFCYICLAFYELIRQSGNSMHEKTCKYHTDNLNQ